MLESRRRPVPREKWPLFHVPAGIAAVHFRRPPAQKGQADSSPTAAPQVCSHLLIANCESSIEKRGSSPSHPHGSSMTRGVVLNGAPEFGSCVNGSVCLIFNVVSISTPSFSEMLTTRKRPPTGSPRCTLFRSLLLLS